MDEARARRRGARRPAADPARGVRAHRRARERRALRADGRRQDARVPPPAPRERRLARRVHRGDRILQLVGQLLAINRLDDREARHAVHKRLRLVGLQLADEAPFDILRHLRRDCGAQAPLGTLRWI